MIMPKSCYVRISFLGASIALLPLASAAAQSAAPEAQSHVEAPVKALTTTEPQPSFTSQSLSDIQNAADELDADGVRVDLTYLDDFIANPGSGIRPNQTGNLGLWGFNADLDLYKLAGLFGTIHEASTVFGLRSGTSMIRYVDSNLGTLAYFGYHEPMVLDLLTYEVKAGSLDIEVGRTNPLRYFWNRNCDNPYACIPGVINGDTALLPPRYAVWGGVASYQLSSRYYLQAGAFEEDAYNLDTNGLNFVTNMATGALIVGEVGSTTTFSNSSYPGHHVLGMFGSTATHNNPYRSALGNEILLKPSDPAKVESGPVGFYWEGRQTVWRQADHSTPRAEPPNLAMSWGLFKTINGSQNFDTEAWVGAALKGVIPHRSSDHFSLRLHYLHLGQDFARFETQDRMLAGGGDSPQPRNEYTVELSYSAVIAPGISFEPDVYYLINPDSYYQPRTAVQPRDGVVVNAFLVISLGRLLGIPTPRG